MHDLKLKHFCTRIRIDNAGEWGAGYDEWQQCCIDEPEPDNPPVVVIFDGEWYQTVNNDTFYSICERIVMVSLRGPAATLRITCSPQRQRGLH